MKDTAWDNCSCTCPVNEYYHSPLPKKVTVLFGEVSKYLTAKHITASIMKWTECDTVSNGLPFPTFCFKASVCIFLKIIFLYTSRRSKNDNNFLLDMTVFLRRLTEKYQRAATKEKKKSHESTKHSLTEFLSPKYTMESSDKMCFLFPSC